MSELKKDLMEKIDTGEVKMRSKNFFIFARAAFEVGLISLIIFAIYLFNLSFYLPKRELGLAPKSAMGPGPGSMVAPISISVIPWHYVLIGVVALALAFWLLYRYSGAYKKHLILTLGAISVVILVTSFVLSISGVNERLEDHRQFKKLYDRPRRMRDLQGQMQSRQEPKYFLK